MVVAVEPDLDARKLLSLLPYAVLVVDREWRITFANQETHRLLGRTGETLWELCPELESTSFGTAFRYAMTDRAELISESALPSVGWLQARARPVPDGGGLLITLRQFHPETSEAVQARQALLIGEVGFALTRQGTLKERLQTCTDALVRHLDAALARIWTVDDVHRELVLQASSGDAVPDQLERVAIGRARIGKIVERGTPYLTNDFAHDARAGNREWAVRDGLTALAGCPLRIDGNVVGVVAVYGRQSFGHDVAGALAAIADSIALGIESTVAEEARRAAETELRAKAEQLELLNEIGKNLTSELEIGPLVQRVTNLATRLAQAEFGAFFYNLEGTSPHFAHVALAGSVTPEQLPALPIGPTQLVPSAFSSLPNVSFLAVPVIARGGKPIGALVFGHEETGTFTEGTERLIGGVAAQAAIAMDNARLFKDARSLIEQLEKTNTELDQFAYVASHDLKAPLRGIANLSQWIEDDLGERMDEQGRYHMSLLRGRVRRLENLIDGILHYSRADRNEGEIVEVDVGRFTGELWELLAPPVTAKLVLKDLPMLHTPRIPLQQVLMNLIGNALKYNQGRPLTVEVGARPEGDAGEMWALYVKDDGVGISPEFHKRIWGLFQTLEPRDKVESTGIGLAVVRKIVEARGGRAWIESEVGAGATFWFTWPATDSPTRNRHG